MINEILRAFFFSLNHGCFHLFLLEKWCDFILCFSTNVFLLSETWYRGTNGSVNLEEKIKKFQCILGRRTGHFLFMSFLWHFGKEVFTSSRLTLPVILILFFTIHVGMVSLQHSCLDCLSSLYMSWRSVSTIQGRPLSIRWSNRIFSRPSPSSKSLRSCLPCPNPLNSNS